MKKRDPEQYKYLKIVVDAGGCSGFEYNFKIEANKDEDDLEFTKDELTILLDEITLSMIHGSTIDYKEEMIRSSFEIVANPNAELGCSCGRSFSLK